MVTSTTTTTDKVNIWQSASLEEGMAEFCNVCSFKFNLDLIPLGPKFD